MTEPIAVAYTEDDGQWSITVSGRGQHVTATAHGILDARARAEELIDEIEPDRQDQPVVHLLDGSALGFTTAYLNARMSLDTSAHLPTDDAGSGNGAVGTAPAEAAEPAESDTESHRRLPAAGGHDGPQAIA